MSWIAIILIQTAGLPPPKCEVDRDAMIALDPHAFDQDMDGGWRALAVKPDCQLAAADLIKDYRAAHPGHGTILFWHEGQLRAGAGQSEKALSLFEQSHQQPNQLNVDTGWNAYVDASIAFLRHDATALKTARDKLANLPPPAQQPDATPEAREIKVQSWPPNLDVVDGLVSCFDQPYSIAYSQSCRPHQP
ncbi:hypothetical protein MOK15_09930 [Sphingobium sp. BYY-5]|uniref:hypothetical protein n=1 Tax=Sphingobium sp. BYY-5 TaxID=2926400 RepID=UPI001FA708F9|nr:hypothetical protein [Sphingobium sp. BYY-5]MCI4590412.1 hypothetical protein [Sphingobium sp. BYY-5]